MLTTNTEHMHNDAHFSTGKSPQTKDARHQATCTDISKHKSSDFFKV